MRKLTIVEAIIVLMLFCCGVGVWMYWSRHHIPVALAPVVSGALVDTTTVTEQPLKQETTYSLVDATYPQFAQADAAFNASIAKVVTDAAADFIKNADANYTARLATATPDEHIDPQPKPASFSACSFPNTGGWQIPD